MGILKIVGTLLPTIGNVLGSLLVGETNELGETVSAGRRILQYDFDSGLYCQFTYDEEQKEYVMQQITTDPESTMTLSIPAIGGMGGENLTVQGCSGIPVTEMFQRCSGADSSKLMLSVSCPGEEAVQQNIANLFHVAAAGMDIPTDGVTEKRIGSYLTVVCSTEGAVFRCTRRIQAITSASFHGCGDCGFTVMDVGAKTEGSMSVVEVNFPAPFPEGTCLDIEVEADIVDALSVIAAQKYAPRPVPEEHIQYAHRLAQARRDIRNAKRNAKQESNA